MPFETSTREIPLVLGAPAAPGPWLSRAFRTIFSRHLFQATMLVLLPAVLAQPLSHGGDFLRDSDLWWHLADARLLFAKLHFLHADPYSFSVAAKPWVNPEWLSEIPFWLGYRALGLRGLYLVTWMALSANVLLAYARAYRRSGHISAAFWTAALAFVLMTVNSGPRTILFAYPAMAAELAIFEEMERGHFRWAWALPPLFCLWINLHGSWFIGLGLLALYVANGLFSCNIGIFTQRAWEKAERKKVLTACAVTVGTLLVNPYGWRLIWNPLDMMLNQKLNIANVEEWQSLNLGTPLGKAAVLAILAMVVANCLRARRWKLYELAFIAFAWFSAFDHARFCFLAAVMTTPFLAEDLGRTLLERPDPEKTVPALNALVFAAAVCFMAVMLPSEARLQADLQELFPQHLIGRIQPSWRTFNQANLGGMLDFTSKPDYLDSRMDIFEHEGVLADYLNIARLQQSFELLDRAHIDHALIGEHSQIGYLLAHAAGWREVAREGGGANAYVLFERTQPADCKGK